MECGCDCDQAARDTCPLDSHVYDTDTCSCGCRDTVAKQTCLDQGRTWSEESCSCHCSLLDIDHECSVGLVWSNVTCGCVPQDSVVTREDQRLARGSGASLESFLSWQLITIAILLILVFILIATIFALIAKLQTAKRRLKTAKLQASARPGNGPATDYDLYAEQQRPAGANKDLIVKTKNAKNPDKIYSEVYCDAQTAGEKNIAITAKVNHVTPILCSDWLNDINMVF